MDFKNKDIISINDFSKDELLYVLKISKQMEQKPNYNLLKDTILATLFFEPSTRTRLSFIHAMESLGGQVLGFDSSESSSAKKGEKIALWSLRDWALIYGKTLMLRIMFRRRESHGISR